MPPIYGFNAKTLIDSGRVTLESLERIKYWCDIQNFPQLTDEQKILFLLSCDSNVEATQKTINSYFKCKKGAPEIFLNRDMNCDDIQKTIKVSQFTTIPGRTPDNSAVIIWRLKDTVYYRVHLEPSLKLLSIVAELPLYDNPPDGLITILDTKGVGLLHLTRLRVGPLKKFFKYIQEGFPCKVKEIHVINTVYFIDKIMMIIRPLISQQLYNTIKFHSSHTDMNDFFQKHVPADCMPEDYGGSLPSQDVLSAQTYNAVRGLRKFYKEEEEQIQIYRS